MMNQPGRDVGQIRNLEAPRARMDFHRRPQQRADVGQFPDRLDSRMTIEHLLEQGRSRSRQADDEDRDRPLSLGGKRALEEGRAKARDEFVDFGGQLLAPIADRSCAKIITPGKMLERGGMVIAVVVSAAEREMEGDDIPQIDRPGERLFHYADVGIVQHARLDVGQRPPCLTMFGFDCGGVAIGGDRVVDPPASAQVIAIADPRLGPLATLRDDEFMLGQRLARAAELVEDQRLGCAQLRLRDLVGEIGEAPGRRSRPAA